MALSQAELDSFLSSLKSRFISNMVRHRDIEWEKVEEKLRNDSQKIEALIKMEESGGEPDVVVIKGSIYFIDCSKETPIGRRNFCYDNNALSSRKNAKPINSAEQFALDLGIELLTEEEYRILQTYGEFDTKTSSWLKTPENIRDLGGAIFGDRRFNTVFIYHNGAESYYSSRGFRGKCRI